MKKMPLLLPILMTLCAAPAYAQSDMPPGARGPHMGMATRSVANYLALERSLEESLASGDKDAVTRTLGEGFGAHDAAERDEKAGTEWLEAELKSPFKSAGVYNLTVREFADLAVVSFILDRRSTQQATHRPQYVVDVWQQSSKQLLSRYATELPPRFPMPKLPNVRE